MRWQLRAFACIALIAALCGCTSLKLPDRYVIADEGWTGSYRLRVGDVLYMTISIKGKSLFSSGALQNPYPLWSDSERIPLRLAPGTLTADEANLLMGFLATGLISPPVDPSLALAIEIARPKLWEALVESLILTRSSTTQPARLFVRMGQESGEADGFCSRLELIRLKDYFFKNECTTTTNPPADIEIRYVRPLDYPLSAITEERTTLESPQYGGQKQVAVSVARVERHGAAMRNKYGQERRWSLADWEGSKICVDENNHQLYITELILRTEPFRTLRVRHDGDARFDIRFSPTDGRTAATNNEAPRETLSESSLSFISPSDVTSLVWGRGSDRNNFAAVDLSRASSFACQP